MRTSKWRIAPTSLAITHFTLSACDIKPGVPFAGRHFASKKLSVSRTFLHCWRLSNSLQYWRSHSDPLQCGSTSHPVSSDTAFRDADLKQCLEKLLPRASAHDPWGLMNPTNNPRFGIFSATTFIGGDGLWSWATS